MQPYAGGDLGLETARSPFRLFLMGFKARCDGKGEGREKNRGAREMW